MSMRFFGRRGGLFVPKHYRVIETDPLMRFEGHVTCRLRNAESGLLLGEWRFKNLLTDTFMNIWGGAAAALAWGAERPFGSNGVIACGTGDTAPANGDTALDAEIAPNTTHRSMTDATAESGVAYVSAVSPDYMRVRVCRRFTTSQANGTIRELGIFGSTSGTEMYARALVKDANGNPTSFVKNNSMTLDVLWEFRLIPIQGDVTDTVSLSAVSYDVTYRACNVGTAAGHDLLRNGPRWASGNGYRQSALRERTAASLSAESVSWAAQAYANGNFYRDVDFTLVEAAASIAVLRHRDSFSAADNTLQIGFAPSLTAGRTTRYRISWARA